MKELKIPWFLAALALCAVIGIGLIQCQNEEPELAAPEVGSRAISGSEVTHLSNLDVAGEIEYGSNDEYPLGYASSGQQLVYGTDVVTGTLAVNHGLSTVTFCVASMGKDPDDDAGDAAHVTVAVSSNVCTVKVWQDDFITAATETDIPVHWLVVGTP